MTIQDVMPKTFIRNAEGQIATYSYTEIASGTGIIVFYAQRVSIDGTSANDIYQLTDTVFPSSTSVTSVSDGQDFDFDVTFNTPRVIKGDLTIVFPMSVSSTGSIQAKLTVIHYDGTTETTLVAQTSSPALSGTATSGERVLKVEVPLTKFAKGETLRLNIEFASTTSSTQNVFSHDPTGSNTTSYTKTGGALKVLVPFRIDV